MTERPITGPMWKCLVAAGVAKKPQYACFLPFGIDTVRALERRGLVTLKPFTEKERWRKVRVTKKGRALLESEGVR